MTFVGAHADNFSAGRAGYEGEYAVVNHIMLGTLAGTAQAFRRAGNGASAHYGVGRDGTVVQYVHEADTAYANGPIRNPALGIVPWLRAFQQSGETPNPACITIEWEGRHTGGQWIKVPWGTKQLDTIKQGTIRAWWTPPEVQYQAGLALIRGIVARWQVPLDRAHICQHADFDSVTRWFCPGMAFPQARLLDDLKRGAVVTSVAPTTELDGVRNLPVAIVQRLLALGDLRLRMAGRVRKVGLWDFGGALGQRPVVACEGVVLAVLPYPAPDDVQKVHIRTAYAIYDAWKL